MNQRKNEKKVCLVIFLYFLCYRDAKGILLELFYFSTKKIKVRNRLISTNMNFSACIEKSM